MSECWIFIAISLFQKPENEWFTKNFLFALAMLCSRCYNVDYDDNYESWGNGYDDNYELSRQWNLFYMLDFCYDEWIVEL